MTERSTSPRGRAFLRSHEGDVLKTYLCPAGRRTIGVGLTKASGVVDPKPGMVITREESDRLLRLALQRNYEPRVSKAMPNAKPHEFDGGVSFDFNTGAIDRASWVRSWRTKAAPAKIRAGLAAWKKGGGKVLPGLVRRREEEADVILFNIWPDTKGLHDDPLTPKDSYGRFVVVLTNDEREAVHDAFRQLGFEPGRFEGLVARDAVEAFQARYDLTVDGLIGRATLSTLQRELDARKGALQGTGAAGAGGAVAGGNEAAVPETAVDPGIVGDPLVTWAGIGIAVAAVLFLLWLAWRYRDLIAARIQRRLPRVATWLRSL